MEYRVAQADRPLITVTTDAIEATTSWLAADRPGRRATAEFRDAAGNWSPLAAKQLLQNAEREVPVNSRMAKRHMNIVQAGWLEAQARVETAEGWPPVAGMAQAYRDWALRFDAAPPWSLVRELELSEAGRFLDLPVAHAAATDALSGIKAVGKTSTPIMGAYRKHWLALAACGPAHSVAHDGAQWHLDQFIETHDISQRHKQRLLAAGATPETARLLAAAALTLQTAGRTQEAERLRRLPRSTQLKTMADPATARTVAAAQQALATALGRRENLDLGRNDVEQKRSAQSLVDEAARLLIDSAPVLASPALMRSQKAIEALGLAFKRRTRQEEKSPEPAQPAPAPTQETDPDVPLEAPTQPATDPPTQRSHLNDESLEAQIEQSATDVTRLRRHHEHWPDHAAVADLLHEAESRLHTLRSLARDLSESLHREERIAAIVELQRRMEDLTQKRDAGEITPSEWDVEASKAFRDLDTISGPGTLEDELFGNSPAGKKYLQAHIERATAAEVLDDAAMGPDARSAAANVLQDAEAALRNGLLAAQNAARFAEITRKIGERRNEANRPASRPRTRPTTSDQDQSQTQLPPEHGPGPGRT